MGPIPLAKFGQEKHLRDTQVQKKRSKEMDADVYEMIPSDFQTAKIVVQSKAEATHRPVEILGIEEVGVKRFLNRGPGKLFQMKIGVKHDVVGVIEMP
jgi:hypothetical protein